MHADDRRHTYSQAVWITLVSCASVLFSLLLACAMPFVAVATIAGVFLNGRVALALTVVAWVANQLVGYLVLGYPTTWDSFAWGGAIGIAALLALQVVIDVGRYAQSQRTALVAGFLCAFLVYEAALFAATAFLPSGDEAFSLAVVGQIFWTNALALVLLLLMHKVAGLLGLSVGQRETEYAS